MVEDRQVQSRTALVADALSILGLPGATFQELAAAHWQRKAQETRDILLNEMSQGMHGQIQFDAADTDPLVDIMLRFSKAVSDGTARENLRLLAQGSRA